MSMFCITKSGVRRPRCSLSPTPEGKSGAGVPGGRVSIARERPRNRTYTFKKCVSLPLQVFRICFCQRTRWNIHNTCVAFASVNLVDCVNGYAKLVSNCKRLRLKQSQLTIAVPSYIVARSNLRDMYHCTLKSKMGMQCVVQLLTVGRNSTLQH